MLSKISSHLILALTFFFLTLAQQYGFFAYKNIPIVFLTPGKYLAVYTFFILASLIKSKKLRLAFLSIVMSFNFFQMVHLSYFGTQILPSEIYLLFSQFHEVQGTLKEDFRHVLLPLFFTILPIWVGWWVHEKLKPQIHFRAFDVLFCLYFFYNPARTFVTGNTWGRQPSTRELTGMNVYLTTSYFLGRILPHKLSASTIASGPNTSLLLKLDEGEKTGWDKIIIIQGESLTPHHMGLFGYTRDTTPFLKELKQTPNFFSTIGLSAGVSTDISVAFFLNLGFGSAGGIKSSTGDHCLFKLAKTKKYSTHFISIQSSEQLRYISPYLCASSLDDYRALEQVAPHTLDHQAASDRDLLKPLAELIKKDDNQFIILHQRGSHSPWNLRYSPEANKFKTEDKGEARINDYDNSVVEFDLFWKELILSLSKSEKKILVIYSSDHGESVGENGRWGHGFIETTSFEIPILIMAFNKDLPPMTRKLPKFLTHYNLGIFLAQELGFLSNQSPELLPSDYVIYGNDIDGFAGKADVKFDEKGYIFKYSP